MTQEILLNLPVKSLGNFKLVCKSWRSLIEDRQFIKQHRNQCQRDINCHKILLASWKWYYYCDCYSTDAPQLQHEHDSDNISLLELPVLPQLDPEINLTLEGVHADDCVFVNSCDGLFLLRFSSDIIVLWNPAIKESRIIPPPISIEEILFPDAGVKNPVLFIAGKNLLLMNETIDFRVLYCMEKNGMRSSWSKILAITKLDDPLNAIYWIDTVAFSKDRDLLLIMLNETFAFEVYDSKRRKFEKARVEVFEQS